MLVITQVSRSDPVPDVSLTGMPTLRFAVLETVMVEPLLLADVSTGLVTPALNLTNTQAASQLEGPEESRQELSQLTENCTNVKLAALCGPAVVLAPVSMVLLMAILLAWAGMKP
jgi:hypothetical protein